jgi:hypothetical protein
MCADIMGSHSAYTKFLRILISSLKSNVERILKSTGRMYCLKTYVRILISE